jgi:hypothetical protein
LLRDDLGNRTLCVFDVAEPRRSHTTQLATEVFRNSLRHLIADSFHKVVARPGQR